MSAVVQIETARKGRSTFSLKKNRVYNMETKNFVQSFDFLPERAKRYADAAFSKYGKDLLTLTEAAEFLTLSRTTFYRLVKAEKIVARPIAGNVRFDLVELALIRSGETLPSYILPENPAKATLKKRGRIPARGAHLKCTYP